MELKRLFKKKSLYIYPLILLITPIIDAISVGEREASVSSMTILNYYDSTMLYAILCAGIISVFLINEEYKKGYIKNFAGLIKNKYIIPLVRFTVSSLIMVLYSVFTFVFSIVMGYVEYKKIVFADNMLSQISYCLLWMFVGIAVIAFIHTIFEVFRSGVASYLVLFMLIFNLLEGLIIQLVALITEKFIDKYMLICQLNYAMDENGEFLPMWGMWIRTGIFLVIMVITGMIASKKKDVI